MRSSRLFRRVIAGLCAAAMLCGGMAAAAAARCPRCGGSHQRRPQ